MYGENGNRPILNSAEIAFLLSDQKNSVTPAKHQWPEETKKTVELIEIEDLFFSLNAAPFPLVTSNAQLP